MSEFDCNTVRLDELLKCLLSCCEKAAQIARTFRGEEDLFSLVVEEKSGIEKNRTVVQDFKTLADVLVQETIKRDVGIKFPVLSKIQGEEQSSFQNTLGECIEVNLTNSLEETVGLLCKVLDGKSTTANTLAAIVHSEDVDVPLEYSSPLKLPANKLGIWIDPIDSTGEYIQAKENNTDHHGFELYGLKCVCVLIGVYDLDTGAPLVGIINQPFYQECSSSSKWKSRIYWGICHNSEISTSPSLHSTTSTRKKKLIVTSMFENEQLQSILINKYDVVHAAGAGYKCLVVAKQTVDLYVLSLPNTHFWDTCGPQAILASQGGGIVSFQKAVNSDETLNHSNLKNYQMTYLEDFSNKAFKNIGGIIAYRDQNVLLEMLQLLKENGYQHK